VTAQWRKALRDLSGERWRTAIVVLAVAAGVAAFSAVLASYATLTRALEDEYGATNPASATLEIDGVDDDLLKAIAETPGVAAVEGRRTVGGRVRTGPAEWRSLLLFASRDFRAERIRTVAPETGAWPPGPGEVLVERQALGVAKARVGDSVLVRTSSGVERTLVVAGTVHDVGRAQARMENAVYGYVSFETLSTLGEPLSPDEVSLVVAGDRHDERHVRDVVASVRATVEGRDRSIGSQDVPAPGEHPHAKIMGLLFLTMGLFGLLVLVLSSVLVLNFMTGLLAAETRQIGVMKALGASSGRIAAIYAVEALALGGAAVAIGFPAGAFGGQELTRAMADFLNFDVASYAVPPWVALLAAASGIGIPLLAAAVPVWRASRVPVREALADVGTSRSTFGAGVLDRALAGVGGPSRPIALAVRNAFRRRVRLALTLVVLSTAGLFFMSALDVRASMVRTLDRLFAARRYDLSVSLAEPSPIDAVERVARTAPGVQTAEAWIMTSAASSGVVEHGGDSFGVVGVPAGSSLIAFDIEAGRGLDAGSGLDAVVVNSALATRAGLKVGDALELRIDDAPVSGRVVGVTSEPFSPPLAYVPRAALERTNGGVSSSIRLALERTDPAAVAAAKVAIESALERAGMRAVGASTKGEGRYGFDLHMEMIYVFLLVMAGVLGAVGGLGLATTMSIAVSERRRELGVLRAIGATPRLVTAIVVAEGVTIGLISWIVAALFSWPVAKALGDLTLGLLFRTRIAVAVEPAGVAVWLAVSVAVAAVASAIPAIRAARRPVREALEYE
jgi:putative ABC transport system permease protein